MAINIKDPETDRMVRALAAKRNQPITDLIKDAVRALEGEEARARQERFDRNMAALRAFQQTFKDNPPVHDLDAFRRQLWEDWAADNGMLADKGASVREEPA